MLYHDYPHLENELINQKNNLLDLVNEEEYEQALTILAFIELLWKKLGYDYKTREIRERIRDAFRHKMIQSTHHKTYAKWEKLYNSL